MAFQDVLAATNPITFAANSMIKSNMNRKKQIRDFADAVYNGQVELKDIPEDYLDDVRKQIDRYQYINGMLTRNNGGRMVSQMATGQPTV